MASGSCSYYARVAATGSPRGRGRCSVPGPLGGVIAAPLDGARIARRLLGCGALSSGALRNLFKNPLSAVFRGISPAINHRYRAALLGCGCSCSPVGGRGLSRDGRHTCLACRKGPCGHGAGSCWNMDSKQYIRLSLQ